MMDISNNTLGLQWAVSVSQFRTMQKLYGTIDELIKKLKGAEKISFLKSF